MKLKILVLGRKMANIVNNLVKTNIFFFKRGQTLTKPSEELGLMRRL